MELELVPLPEPEHMPESHDELSFYAAAIGYRNTHYYLRHFEHFDAAGPRLTWNWAAALPTFFWFSYRKMWGWALFYLLLPVALTVIVAAIVPTFPAAAHVGIAFYLAIVVLLFPLSANWLYYGHVNRKIASIKRLVREREVRLRMIAAEGGTSRRMPAMLAIVIFAGSMASFVAYAIPTYQHYLVRNQVSRAIAVGNEYQRMVEEYALRHQRWPQYVSDLTRVRPDHGPHIDGVVVNNGRIFILLAGEQALAGKTLALLPSQNSRGDFLWECRGLDIADHYLPRACRREVRL